MRKILIKNKKIYDNKNSINWLKIVCFQFLKCEPNKIFSKNTNKDEFKSFKITRQIKKIL